MRLAAEVCLSGRPISFDNHLDNQLLDISITPIEPRHGAIAIISCIAAVVSAYRDGGAIVDRIKQKRLARQAPPPTRLLEESLARGPRAVEEAKENGIERFGPKYAAGDKVALDSLKDILIDLQGSLIKHLRRAQEDDNMADFTTLVDASDIGRIRTVMVLNQLYMRVAMEETISQRPLGDAGSFTALQLTGQNSQLSPKVCSDVPSSQPSYPNDSNTIPATRRLAPSPQTLSASAPEQQAGGRNTPKPGFFDRFRRKSSTEGSSRPNSGRSSNAQLGDRVTPPGSRHSKMLSLSPMTPPQASIDEDNPWVMEGSRQNTAARPPSRDKSISRATTLVPSIRQGPSTMSSVSPTPHERMLSPYELHGGFCKGAYKLQVHDKEAMKIRNQSVAKTGEGYYWACCSSRCAFEGPARRDGKDWAYDDTVREAHGVRYRRSFLAKAHVALPKVKNGIYDYGCVFCIYDGLECPAYHGIKDFLEHVASHRGKSIAETMLQRIKCVNDRLANLDEGFDVNLLPIEAVKESAADNDTSQLAPLGMMSPAASDRVSWGTNDKTMEEVDPWRDAT